MKVLLKDNADLEIFPFVTQLHNEVVIRHLDGESQDIEMCLEEAEEVAHTILTAVAQAKRTRKAER